VALDLKKKVGPLSTGAWVLTGVGVAGAYYLYKRVKGSGSGANAAALGTSAGGTIPGDTVTSLSGTGTTTYSTYTDWLMAAIGVAQQNGLSFGDAYNAISGWLNGQCIDPKSYNGISAALAGVGFPPGYSSGLPTLTACPSSSGGGGGGGGGTPTPPPSGSPPIPALSPNLAAAMLNNGEHVVSATFDPATKTFLYLTNLGGIYTQGLNGQPGGAFYGSYVGLPAADRQGTRTFEKIIANADGSYTAVASDGATYTFQPGTPQAA
jgi:hypothetical protein